MSKIDTSLWAAFMLEYDPWSRWFCRVLEAIAKWRLVLSKNPPKNSLFTLFGRRSLSFVGWCKVKHLNNDLRQKRVRSPQHLTSFCFKNVDFSSKTQKLEIQLSKFGG